MRENRSYGSVRGVAGDRYPYRDPPESTTGERSCGSGGRADAPAGRLRAGSVAATTAAIALIGCEFNAEYERIEAE